MPPLVFCLVFEFLDKSLSHHAFVNVKSAQDDGSLKNYEMEIKWRDANSGILNRCVALNRNSTAVFYEKNRDIEKKKIR